MTAAAMPMQPAARRGEPPWNRAGEPTLGVASTPVVSALLAACTFGLLPALIWPARWAAHLTRERGFYRELADWWRRQADPPAAAKLDPVLRELRARPVMVVLPWLAVAFVALTAVSTVPWDGWNLTIATYGYNRRHGLPPLARMHTVWNWTLAFAYGCQWYAVRSHANAVGDLVKWTNRQVDKGQRVRSETARLGITPLWVGVAVAFCFAGAWWAIPMALAGAAQRRYAERAGPRLHASLSAQAADAAALMAAAVGTVSRFCPSVTCGARLPASARFCGRCGTPAAF